MGDKPDYLVAGRRADGKNKKLDDRQMKSLKAMLDDGSYGVKVIETRFGRSITWLRAELASWEKKEKSS